MATGLCRYDGLAETNAFIDGAVLEGPLASCDEPAEHLAILVRRGDGLEIEIRADLCTAHDRLVSLAEGYERSIKRRPATT